MAVVPPATLHWLGASGSASFEGAEYDGVWRVKVDDALDQAKTVLTWFQLNVVALGDPYAYANDGGVTTAFCDKISADRDKGSTDVWNVFVHWGPLDEDEGEDPDGNPTADPLEFRPTIRARTNQYTRPSEIAEFRYGFLGKSLLAVPVGTKTVPMNSALVPFNPGLEQDDSRVELVITRNLPLVDFEDYDEFANYVNIDAPRLNGAVFNPRFDYKWAKWQGKIRGVDMSPRRKNGIDYLEATVAIDIDKRDEGWITEVVDRGIIARAIDGDPDGRGGVIDPQQQIEGVPMLRRLLDLDEQPLTDPVLLNGEGQPLPLDVTPIVPINLGWLKYKTTSFRTLKFFQDGNIFV